jgi:hypothetical protein
VGCGASASCRPAQGADRQHDGPQCVEGHHASGPQRVHLLGRGCQASDDPKASHSPDARGAGGRPASTLLLARVHASRAHRAHRLIAIRVSAAVSGARPQRTPAVSSCEASDDRKQIPQVRGTERIGIRRQSLFPLVNDALSAPRCCMTSRRPRKDRLGIRPGTPRDALVPGRLVGRPDLRG